MIFLLLACAVEAHTVRHLRHTITAGEAFSGNCEKAYPGTKKFSPPGAEGEECECVANPTDKNSEDAWTCPEGYELVFEEVACSDCPNTGLTLPQYHCAKTEETEVASPTFSIVNEYLINDNLIYHYDLYRVKNIDELNNIGFLEDFNKSISIIEWPELLYKKIDNKIDLFFEYDDSFNSRYLTIKSDSKKINL